MAKKKCRTTTVRRAGNVITFTDCAREPDQARLHADLAGLHFCTVDGVGSSVGGDHPLTATLTFKDATHARKAYERMFVGDDSLPDEAGGVAGVDLFTHRDDDWPNAKIRA